MEGVQLVKLSEKDWALISMVVMYTLGCINGYIIGRGL
jgi:hypothetical protein